MTQNKEHDRTAQTDFTLSETTERMKGGTETMKSEKSPLALVQNLLIKRDMINRILDNISDRYSYTRSKTGATLYPFYSEICNGPIKEVRGYWSTDRQTRDDEQNLRIAGRTQLMRDFCRAYEHRMRNRDSFEQLLREEIKKLTPESNDNYDMKSMLVESLATPYADRSPQDLPVAAKELTEEQWEAKRDQILKPRNESL